MAKEIAGYESDYYGGSSVKLYLEKNEVVLCCRGKVLARLHFRTLQQMSAFEEILRQGFGVTPYGPSKKWWPKDA